MQIVLLDEARFDSFALNHPNQNYYQSSQYGRFISKHGYNSYYLGMIDNTNEIKAATLIIVKNDKNNSKRKMGYAPRGFVIDWNKWLKKNAIWGKIWKYITYAFQNWKN